MIVVSNETIEEKRDTIIRCFSLYNIVVFLLIVQKILKKSVLF